MGNPPTGRNTVSRSRRIATWATLIICPTLVVWYLACHHGLGSRGAAMALVACYVLGIAPGFLLQSCLFGLHGRSLFETLLSSLALGLLVSPLVWYLLSCLGLGVLFAPLWGVVGLVVAALGLRGWRLSTRRTLWYPAYAELCLVWLVLGSAILWSYSQSIVEFRDGRGYVRAYLDHMYHAARVAELARGVPMDHMPYVVGPSRLAYHDIPEVGCDLMRRFCGVGVLEGYFYLGLPMRYVLLGAACYLALVRRFGGWSAVAGCACLFLLVGLQYRHVLSSAYFLLYMFHSLPGPFGMAVVFMALYYVSMARSGRGYPHMLLASMLAALLPWYKANFVLPVLPAMAIVVAWMLYRRRAYRWLAACLGAQVVLVLLNRWHMAGADAAYALAFRPLAFLHWWWVTLGLPHEVDAVVRGGVDALPAFLRWPVVWALCVAYRFHVLVACTVILVAWCGFGRRGSPNRGYDGVVLMTIVMCVIGFALFPVAEDRFTGRDLTWDISAHLFYVLWALSMALLGPLLVWGLSQLWRARIPVRVVAVALLAGLVVTNAVALRRLAVWQTRGFEGYISSARYDAFTHIADATAPEALVLHPWQDNPATLASMLTQRRMVLDGYGTWQGCYDARPVIRDVAAFYSADRVDDVLAILRRYRPDYVMVDRGQSWRPPVGAPLREAYRNEEVIIFAVLDEVRTARTDPCPQGRLSG